MCCGCICICMSDILLMVRCFRYYQSLGERRSLLKVSEDLGVPLDTLKDWSRRYNWVARVSGDDMGVGGSVDGYLDFVLEEVLALREVVRESFIRPALEGGLRFDLSSPRELRDLVRVQGELEAALERLMALGESPSRGGVVELEPVESVLSEVKRSDGGVSGRGKRRGKDKGEG